MLVDLENKWCSSENNVADYLAVKALADNYSELGCKGIIILNKGQPVSASAGYEINERYFDFSYSKSSDEIKGLSDFAKHALAEKLIDSYEFLNGEEDLGLEGLREKKILMRPCFKIDMYKAVKV